VQEAATAKALWEKAKNGPRKQDVDAAAAEVEALTQGVAQAQRQLDKATLAAPFRGRIERRLLDVGAYVNVFPTGGVPVVHVVDMSQVDAVIAVPEVHRRPLAEFTHIEIVSAVDPQLRADGKVVSLGEIADPASGTYQLRARVANSNGRWTGGMVVTAETTGATSREAIRIPLSALLPGYGEAPHVMLVDPADNRVAARQVQVGRLAGDRVEITGGLEANDLLIVRGQDRVIEGDRVEPRKVAANNGKE
jgi:membrane fusion protein (multidrug efflux system)